MERCRNIVEIFEEIQMILVHIQDDAQSRDHGVIAVRILAGFGDEIFGLADADIAADRRENSSHRDCRIHACTQHDVRCHGCGRCLAVGAGNCYRYLVILHHLAEEFSSCQHGNAGTHSCRKFRIIRMNRCGVDNDIEIGSDVFSRLTDDHMRAFGF